MDGYKKGKWTGTLLLAEQMDEWLNTRLQLLAKKLRRWLADKGTKEG